MIFVIIIMLSIYFEIGFLLWLISIGELKFVRTLIAWPGLFIGGSGNHPKWFDT